MTGHQPKCLARVGDRTLLDRQIGALRRCGIDRITVVAGHHAADVRRACDPGVDIIVNTRYESTNSLYSLWLARDLLLEGFVVLNCDVIFHDQLLWDLLTARDEDALLMAAVRGQVYSDEEMKIRVRAGCVADISKTLDPADTDGENVGIAKFGAAGARGPRRRADGGAGRRRRSRLAAARLRIIRPPAAPARRRDARFPVDRNRLSRRLLARLRRGAACDRRRLARRTAAAHSGPQLAAADGARRSLHHV